MSSCPPGCDMARGEEASSVIACFITPHGFGHATRAAAVLAELSARVSLVCHFYGNVPPSLLAQSLDCAWSIRPCETDVGFVQRTAVEEDLPATLARLERLLPYKETLIDALAGDLRQWGCRLVLCDIAAMGVAAARRAGIPSVLVENFTWDWIYQGYLDQCPGLAPYQEQLRALYAQADIRVQTEPVCAPCMDAQQVGLICRKPRLARYAVRQRLGLREGQSLVLVTMGGVGAELDIHALRAHPEALFVLSGGQGTERWQDNLRLLPTQGRWYHPDLMAASDLVVGKLGYSTLAEACQAGIPFAVVGRPRFPESPVLAGLARRRLAVRELSASALADGSWLRELPRLLCLPRRPPVRERGAAEVARLLVSLLA